MLRQRIEEGHYRAGEKLPREAMLAEEWEVSRATLRAALAQLEQLSLVVRKQGLGTFVSKPAPIQQGPVLHGSIDALIAATQLTGTTDVRIERGSDLPLPVAERLGLTDSVGTVITRRRIGEDGASFGWLVNYLSDTLAETVTPEELYESTLLELLLKQGVSVQSAIQSIRARVADVDAAKALDIDVGAPVLAVERLVYDSDGRPVELLHSYYRSDVYQYRVSFTR